jgi:hypothetical protein
MIHPIIPTDLKNQAMKGVSFLLTKWFEIASIAVSIGTMIYTARSVNDAKRVNTISIKTECSKTFSEYAADLPKIYDSLYINFNKSAIEGNSIDALILAKQDFVSLTQKVARFKTDLAIFECRDSSSLALSLDQTLKTIDGIWENPVTRKINIQLDSPRSFLKELPARAIECCADFGKGADR